MATFDFDAAAHLLRRAGFGGPPEEIKDLAARGLDGAADYLLNFTAIDNSALTTLLNQSFDFTNPEDSQRLNRNELRRYWFTRMVHSKRQFEEKATLFWHNFFATSFSKVNDQFMYAQNLTLRANVLVRFDDLLLNVAQDPAMLIWLDNITNVLGSPNENWARELQELFSMGPNDVVTGTANYTEEDVKEIARAFTGWKFRRQRGTGDRFTFEFFINSPEHDNGLKTVYGQTANFSGEDIITIIAARRATARFLVKKIFTFFVYPLTDSAADKNTIDKFADVYLASNHNVKELFRAIFTSDEFFSSRARFGSIKNPIEIVVGAIRMLGGVFNPGTPDGRRDNSLHQWSANMGMDAFNPPDVSGWELNDGWINTANLLNRFNYANTLITTRANRPDAAGFWVTNDQLAKYTKTTSKGTVKEFLKVLGPLAVDKKTLKKLKSYLTTDDQGNSVEWVVNDTTIDKKVRGLVHQIMILPEFQLN